MDVCKQRGHTVVYVERQCNLIHVICFSIIAIRTILVWATRVCTAARACAPDNAIKASAAMMLSSLFLRNCVECTREIFALLELL